MRFFRGKPKEDHFYLVTWVMKGNAPKMAVISLKQARNRIQAEHIAQVELNKLHSSGRPYFIHVTNTPDIGDATRQAKAKYLFDSGGDIDTSTNRAYHPDSS